MTDLLDIIKKDILNKRMIREHLEDRLFVDEVMCHNLTLPKGTIVTKCYEVILPDGITKEDLISQQQSP